MKREDDNQTFLNLIVQKIDPSNIQDFMRAWLRQECKDFRLVFIQNKDASDEEKQAITYACGFASAIGYSNLVVAVASEDKMPEAKMTKILKDTSILPVDKMEVLRMRAEAGKKKIEDQKIEKLEEKVEQNTETKNAIGNRQKLAEKNDATKIMLQQKPIDDKVGQKKKVIRNKVIIEDRCKPRIVCYTCITGEYDQILEPLAPSPNIDFICFSDKQIQSKTWKWRQIPEDLKDLDKIRQQRSIKICPHRYLKEYDISIWVDGNIQIKDNLNKFIKQYNLEVCPLWIRKHPKRDCIYAEAKECIAQKKAPKEIIEKQIAKYRAVKYPEHNKLVESNIILRRHLDRQCKYVCDVWMAEILLESHRDQLSFNYVCWATKFNYGVLNNEANITNQKNRLFNWNIFHNKKEMNTSYITIAVCNFNTKDLTNACLLSLKKNVTSFKWKAIILDNSNKEKFILNNELKDDVTVYDNTSGKIIDFNLVLKQFGKSFDETHGSLKHAFSIQYLLNTCITKYLILLDSDVIIKRDFDFIKNSNNYISIFDIGQRKTYKPRALPFIQLFNVEQIKNNNIKYFDPFRIRGGLSLKNSAPYDTGASFYEDIVKSNLKFKQIDFTDYIFHLRSASFSNKNSTKNFLDRYKCFFSNTTNIDPILNYKVIVSLTSWNTRIYDGSLLATLQSILQQKFNGKIKIVLTLTNDDKINLPENVKIFLQKNSIEVLTATEDIKPHKKYFYTMLKYKQLPIITIDDDLIYDDDLVQSLYNSYKEFPDCISARRVHKMTYSSDKKLLSYRQWKYEDKSLYATPSNQLFATGGGGVIYPENCLHISIEDLPLIKKSLNADDVFLKKKEQHFNIQIVHARGKRDIAYTPQKSSTAEYALCFKNNSRNRCDNDVYIKLLNLN